MAKNRMYQLYELKDSLEEAINNTEKLLGEQRLLVATLVQCKNAKVFTEFCKSISSQWPEYEGKIVSYRTRLKQVEHLISMFNEKDGDKRTEKAEFVASIVTELLEAMGAVAPETKTEA